MPESKHDSPLNRGRWCGVRRSRHAHASYGRTSYGRLSSRRAPRRCMRAACAALRDAMSRLASAPRAPPLCRPPLSRVSRFVACRPALRAARPLSAAAKPRGGDAPASQQNNLQLAKGALVCFERDDKRQLLVLLTRPDGKTRWFGTDAVRHVRCSPQTAQLTMPATGRRAAQPAPTVCAACAAAADK